MPVSSILRKYGEIGITEYELRDGITEISNDTQMTLFTATGLLRGVCLGRHDEQNEVRGKKRACVGIGASPLSAPAA